MSSNRSRFFISVVVSAALGGSTAMAQSNRPSDVSVNHRGQDALAPQPDENPARESRRGSGSKWEIEAHGGFSTIGSQNKGSGSLPTTGAIVGGLMGVSSFYLGEGARLFNQNQVTVAGGQPVPAIVPLDPVLLGSALRGQSVGTFGLRVGRAINHRMIVEATADLAVLRLSFAPAALTGIEATRSSLVPALEHALSSLPSPPSLLQWQAWPTISWRHNSSPLER